MGLVGLVGLLCASLRQWSPTWACLNYTLAVASLALAVVAAVVARGQTRSGAIGFVVCGGSYLLLAMFQWRTDYKYPPYLISTYLTDWIVELLANDSDGSKVPAYSVDSILSLGSGWAGARFALRVTRDQS